MNARHPAPVVKRVAVTHRLATTILGALHRAIPGRVPAAYYGVSYVCSFHTTGWDGARGVPVEIKVGGSGAHADRDGISRLTFGMRNNFNIPAEMIESELPLSPSPPTASSRARAATGRHRGGLGLFWEQRIDSARAVFTANLKRFTQRSYGLEGGEPGRQGRIFLIRGGERTAQSSKVNNLRRCRSAVVRLETSDGGGYGDPAGRGPEARARDLALGYVPAARS